MYSLLKNKNRGLRDDVVEFARELVAIPSHSLHEGDVAQRVMAQMQRVGFEKVLQDEAGNVVGLMGGRSAEPTLLLNTHMDTVQPGSKDRWEGSPYSARIEDGRLFGVGAADCKGGIAAHVFAGALLKRSLLPLRGNLVVAVTTAEENGCGVGVRTLLDQTLPGLNLKPTQAILGEPTDLGLYYGHDGWVEMDIHVEGSNPFLVDDAAEAIFREYTASPSENPELYSVSQPSYDNPHGARRATIQVNRRMRTSEEVNTVLSQTRHDAGLAAQPTGSVAVEVEVRKELQTLCTGKTSVVRRQAYAWSTDPFDPLVERARQALTAASCPVRPAKWNLNHIGMGTSGGVLTREYDIATIGYGPGEEAMAHAANESLDLNKLSECVYGTAAIVHSLIGIPVFGWTTDEI
jgi:acetylornithine deacetylase/succinyl-diaminopimelate desuccinylase-like protein